MIAFFIRYCYPALCCILSLSKRTAALTYMLLKIVWYIVFGLSWCLLELAWLMVLAGIWIGLKLYCSMTRLMSPPATAVQSTRCPRATTAPASVSPRKLATRNISVVTTSSTATVSTATVGLITKTSGIARNTSGDNWSGTATNIESDSIRHKVCRSTSKAKAVDKSCTTSHASAAESESLPSVALSSVTERFAPTSSSTPAAEPSRQSSSAKLRPVSSLTNSDVTSSICSTQNVGRPTCAPLSAVRPIPMPYNSDCTSKPKPVNSMSMAVHIADSNTQQMTQLVEPLSSPIQRAAAPARERPVTSGTSVHTTPSAVEDTPVIPHNVSPASVTIDRAIRATTDENVPVIFSSSSSSLLSQHGINAQSNCDTANTSTTQTDEHSQFPLSDEYQFRLVCDVCFKPKVEIMVTKTAHSCRQDILAVKKIGTSQWRWIRRRKTSINFRGDYGMCIKRQDNMPNSCYNGCSYAHCDAEKLLWDMEKKLTFSIARFISVNRTSAPICNVKDLLNKYPVSFFFCFPSFNQK